jgi:hypothetical protein
MKIKVLPILLIVSICLISACGPAPAKTVEITRLVPQTVEITQLVRQTQEVTRVVNQTVVVTQVPTFTPSPRGTPEKPSNLATKVNNFELSALLKLFPITTGTSWSYTAVNYSQAGSDPDAIVTAITFIDERVVDTQSQPPYYITHIQRRTTLVKVDPGWWQYNEGPHSGNEDFWYVVQGGRVYLSHDRPDPARLKLELLSEEYNFPMAPGASWCPNKIQKGNLTPVPGTPVPCATAGARTVLSEGSYTTQAGSFDHCYQLSDFYESGGPLQVFCDGVGIVAVGYNQLGSQFGYSKWLVNFFRGSNP